MYTIHTIRLWAPRGSAFCHQIRLDGLYVCSFGRIANARKYVKQHGGTIGKTT